MSEAKEKTVEPMTAAAKPKEAKIPVDEVSIKLIKPHRHAGVDYLAGDVIVVNQHTADFIILNQVGVKA